MANRRGENLPYFGKKANIGHILHTKRNGGFYGVFPTAGKNKERNQSLK
jgi:hypothetical protein